MKAKDKTNALRLLEQKKIDFKSYTHGLPAERSGAEIAEALGQDARRVFKTLVTVSDRSKRYYVFMIPVCGELDLKKAAKAAGEKSIEMIHAKELLPLTGYVHGGCSPIGMKKYFPTFIDSSAESFETIFFSGGKVGLQLEMPLSALQSVVAVTAADITKG
ncbi:MAG: Cys-tRNA(Pro) deacylase [Ruminococcus sp.]|nr:Cys-tRNA(Pro) deacylase [Ruminococcus sp.]